MDAEKMLDVNDTRILYVILKKSWKLYSTKQQMYGHLPFILQTIQVRQTRHAEHCWRSNDQLISDTPLRTPAHGHPSVDRPARTYISSVWTQDAAEKTSPESY